MHGPDRSPPPQATSLQFASAVRAFAATARDRGLDVPSFRSPPRVSGVDRTMRRRPDGGVTISVRLRDRPWPAVLADMIDGLIVANRLDGFEAAGARAAMWGAAEHAGLATGDAGVGVRRTTPRRLPT